MDLIRITNEIEDKIRDLGYARKELQKRANDRATAIGEYEKKLAMTVISLRNGQSMSLEGIEIKDPPTTIIDKIAKGLCYKEKIKSELAESAYKIAIVGIEALKAELSALQSIYKYQEIL